MSTVTENTVCQVCNKPHNGVDLISASSVRPSMVQIIKKECPNWSEGGFICIEDLNRFRMNQVEEMLQLDQGELSAIDKQVVDSLNEQELLTKNLNSEFESKMTFGQRIADKIAEFGGSWNFILLFLGVLVAWIVMNTVIMPVMMRRPAFDIYPFMLMNLVLSCLAAIQAPVIMMSQNRQESKDRLRSEHDYKVNLKAELEIRNLHEKIDHLLQHQWQRLLEIQEEQMDVMSELLERSRDSQPAQEEPKQEQ